MDIPNTAGLSDADLRRLADVLSAKMVNKGPEAEKVDGRGRGNVGDAWVMDFHNTCPHIQLVANAGRLYAYCEGHRCLGLVGYEFGKRITFEDATAMEYQEVPAEVVKKRFERAQHSPALAGRKGV